MEKVLLSILFFLCMMHVHAQAGRQVDNQGNLLYQYQRKAEKVDGDVPCIAVDFIFINGVEPRAITYRQEKMTSAPQWTRKDKGDFREESGVESLTANLKPGETVHWEFTFKKGKMSAEGVAVEKAALMILNEEGVVEKIVFDEVLCK